ncbi:MAG: recombinase family protein [Oscillospiraceae bacterium]|nr:recombinase family protein [Oscillospiraceae bacterium]
MAIKRQHGAFINARYSTDNQNPDSIEVQVDKCTEWCRQNDMPILGVFADEATSGMKDTRPQYEAMMQQLRQGLADTVVIYDQSRMFRKMTAWFAFRDELSSMGVRVVCVTQPMIGKDLRDPTNFLTEGSMALFNQIWALQTRQKVMEKMRFMARNGLHTGGKPALGYVVEDGRLVVCEEEAATVRRIFREYASGMSYRQIIEGLNADGIKTKRGNTFGSNSLHDLLHNEKYIGVLTYGAMPYREDGTRNTHSKDGTDVIRIEDAIPPIVDKDLFDRVQQKLNLRKRQQGGRPAINREYPLRGKVFCAECKSAMTVSISHQKYYYYRCTGKKRLHTCDAAPIAVDELEQAVIDNLRSFFGSPQKIEELIIILRSQSQGIQNDAVARLQVLIAQSKEISTKLDNALDAVLNGLASPALKDRIVDLETQKATVERDMRILKANVDASALPEQRLREILANIIRCPEADPSVLFSLVYRVEVASDRIDIWTILDADPDGHIDLSTDAELTTTVQFPSGVPIKDAGDDKIHCVFYLCREEGTRTIKSQYAGGILLQPVQKNWLLP